YAARGEVRFRSTQLDYAIVFFIAAMILSLVFNSLYFNQEQFGKALKTIGYCVIEWFLLFYIVVSIVRDTNRAKKLTAVLTILISIVAVVGIIEYFAGFRFFEWLRQFIPGGELMKSNLHERALQAGVYGVIRGGVERIVSTTISFQEVGTLMAMAIPMLFYFLAYSRKPAVRLLCMSGLAFATGALFLSVTRGAILAALVAVLFQSLLSRKLMLRSTIVIGAAVVIITFILFPVLYDAIVSVASPDVLPQEGTVQTRLDDWPEAGRIVKGHELFGIGVGQVLGKQLAYGTEVETSFRFTDNYYLAAYVEMGLVGIAALALIWFTIFLVLTRGRAREGGNGNTEARDLRAALLSSAIAFMVTCVTFDALGFLTVSKTFWIIVGLGFAVSMDERIDLAGA
ncbi:MAG: hypothetical protein C4534_04625, partial [Gaiellales bacterium]